MKKNTAYFTHDYNASNDTKILFLRQELGMEGYGIFWYIVEQLAQAGGRLPMKIIPIIAMQTQVTQPKIHAIVTAYDLFVIEDGEFFSSRLCKHLELRDTLKIAGKNGAVNRWGNSPPNSHPIPLPNGGANSNKRKRKEIKEKENKEKESKEITIANADAFAELKNLDADILKEFILHRKRKRAIVTDRIMMMIFEQARQAGISSNEAMTIAMERGWQTFKAEWHNKQQFTNKQQTNYDSDSTRSEQHANDHFKRLAETLDV